MKVYIIIKNKDVSEFGYTSLAETCDKGGVSYDSAVRGKRIWIVKGDVVEIKEIEIVKIKGRGNKFLTGG